MEVIMVPTHEFSFEIADRQIGNLLEQLANERLCSYCTARALAFHAAFLAKDTMGSAQAIEMFEDIISTLHKHNVSAPDPH
jgi:hypothetical protein